MSESYNDVKNITEINTKLKKFKQSKIGRPAHNVWNDGFRSITINNKRAAFCNICSRSLRNTGSERLMKHRRVCRSDADYSNCLVKNDLKNVKQEIV